MAPWLFTEAINKGEKIKIYNNGHMSRDFTYIDDVTELIGLLLRRPPLVMKKSAVSPLVNSSNSPYAIYNVGNENPVDLMTFIRCIEFNLGRDAIKEFHGMQEGDVEKTFADISELKNNFNFQPKTSLQDGIKKWVDWYLSYVGNVTS